MNCCITYVFACWQLLCLDKSYALVACCLVCRHFLVKHEFDRAQRLPLECRDTDGTSQPPFSVFVGNQPASTPGTYAVLDNTNCTAYPVQFTADSQMLSVPCSREGRFVVIKATGGPLVLCEAQVYGSLMTIQRVQSF